MPYRLIHDSDLDDVAEAAAKLRANLHPDRAMLLLNAVERMFDRNEQACTIDEAEKVRRIMRSEGTHFTGALAELYDHSDSDNRQRLRAAFARVFKEHA